MIVCNNSLPPLLPIYEKKESLLYTKTNLSSIQHNNLIPYRFVPNSSQMTSRELIKIVRAKYGVK